MYRWKLEFVLKSGKELTVYYEGAESNSREVANQMLTGNENTMNGFSNKDNTANIYVKLGEIAAASISTC